MLVIVVTVLEVMMKINEIHPNELFDIDTVDMLKSFICSMLCIDYNKYYRTIINFVGSSSENYKCLCVYGDAPKTIKKSYGPVTAKSLNIEFFKNTFIEKYGNYNEEYFLTLCKEEIIREFYKLGITYNNNNNNRGKECNKMIWELACDLESGSYYDFVFGITPKLFNFPPKLSAGSYYCILSKNIDDMMKESDQSYLYNEGSNGNNGGSIDSSQNASNKDSNENIESNDSNSEENKDAQELEDNKDMQSSNNNENLRNLLNGDLKDTERNSNDISENIIREYIKQLDISEDIIQSEMYNIKSSTLSNSSVALGKKEGIYIREVMIRNETNDEVFNKINRYISNFENQTTITKVHKKKSFKKYSWKTDDRRDNILYAGNMKYRSGAIKVFDSAPVVFFDFSYSTETINKQLNILLYTFWSKGFICCTYNNELNNIYKPKDCCFWEMSKGGTNTLAAIDEYFLLEKNNDKNIHQNIYVITDGDERYKNLFANYPSAKIFKLIMRNNNDITIMLKQNKNGEEKNSLFYGKKL